ncbi:hypothetical protein PHLCEN_2v2783 [Hermanssonia centrifuga]|uniref:Uncharacterized protein n=1 Tax=Hermanssonia centrifuga TaxID=98765 RepID=A0A2R6RHZ1_9APHY|nr:hypothetical protein PHLCEN_2v2783 [Hermanssonia centrifuga]
MSDKVKLDKETQKKLDVSHRIIAIAPLDYNKSLLGFPCINFCNRGECPYESISEQNSTTSPSSPFHISHAASSTDPTVYPPPHVALSSEPDTKKRKLADGAANGSHTNGLTSGNSTETARFSDRMLANPHLSQVFAILKKECEELADGIWTSLQDKVKLWVNLAMPK